MLPESSVRSFPVAPVGHGIPQSMVVLLGVLQRRMLVYGRPKCGSEEGGSNEEAPGSRQEGGTNWDAEGRRKESSTNQKTESGWGEGSGH
jgi:hypothetical protein